MLRSKPFFIVAIDEDCDEQFMNPEIGEQIRNIGQEEVRILRLRQSDTQMLGDICQRANYSLAVWGPRRRVPFFPARSMEVVRDFENIVGQEQIYLIAEVDTKFVAPMRLYWDVLESTMNSMKNRAFNISTEVNDFSNKRQMSAELWERKKQEVLFLERELNWLNITGLSPECANLARKIVKLTYLRPRRQPIN